MCQISVGHNNFIAWGQTTTGMDLQDLFIINSLNDTHYLVDAQAVPFDITTTSISVKVCARLCARLFPLSVCECTPSL